MDEMSAENVTILREEVRAAVRAVADRHGLTLRVKGGNYDPSAGTYNPKIELSLPDAAQRQFTQDARWLGLEPEDFGRTFEHRGKVFTISGTSRTARSYPVLAMCREDGRTCKFASEFVTRKLRP